MTVDLNQHNNLDAYLKVTLEIEFLAQFKKLDDNGNATEENADQSMFSKNFRKNQENTTKTF